MSKSGETSLAEAKKQGASFSGYERNHLFLSKGATEFFEASGISGADDPSDARSFAILDFDHDGWNDFVTTNANAPRTRLFRNRMGELAAAENNFVAIRFVGGNQAAKPSEQFGPRDGFGAMAMLDLGDMQLKREFRAGEGRSAQNSSTMIIGIGSKKSVGKLTVRWPSGIEQELVDIPAGIVVTAYENEADAPGDSSFELTPYRPAAKRAPDDGSLGTNSVATSSSDLGQLNLAGVSMGDEPLRIFTTMATWCASCRGKLPGMRRLRDSVDSESVAMYGVPVDPEDTTKMLEDYAEKLDTPYNLLATLPLDERKQVQELVIEQLGIDALPATIITDDQGVILQVMSGAPTVSDVRKLLAR